MKPTLSLAAVLLALPLACAFADDEEPPAEPPPAEQPQNPGITPTPIGEGARRTPGSGKLDKDPPPSPEDLQEAGLGSAELKKYRFKVFEGVPDGTVTMPDSPNGRKARMHGALIFTDPYDAYAVAFHVGSEKSSGLCSTADEGQTIPTDDNCNYKYWISRKPGGPPVHLKPMKFGGKKLGPKCVSGSGWTGGGVSYRGAPYEPTNNACDGLKPGAYYCNFISLWVQGKTKKCGLVLGAPIVQYP